MGSMNLLTETESAALTAKVKEQLDKNGFLTLGQLYDILFDVSDGRFDFRHNCHNEVGIINNWFEGDEEVEWGL